MSKGCDEMRGLLDPKMDFVFKNIFGSEKNPKILISFLNATLKPKYLITAVEFKKFTTSSYRQRYSFVTTSGKSVAQKRI